MTGKRIKDFYRFVRSVQSFTDGQVSVLNWDETELREINVQVQPNDGPYEGGRFHFTIKMDTDFPESYPEVNCKTEIYHPNIDPTSEEYNVCLSLFDEWTPSFGLRDVIQGLLFLFYNPNLEDPLSSYFGDTLNEDEFEENVRASLRGEDIDDYSFPWNYYGKDTNMLATKPDASAQAKDTTSTTDASNLTEHAMENLQTADVEVVQEATDADEVKEDNACTAVEETRTTENQDDEIETRTEEVSAHQELVEDAQIEIAMEVQDITAVLEKVTELMAQNNVTDNDEEEDAGAETNNAEHASDGAMTNTESAEATNCDNTDEISETEGIFDMKTENEDTKVNTAGETPTVTDEVDVTVHPLQRQSSKMDNTSQVIEASACAEPQVPPAVMPCTASCAMSSGNPEGLVDCIDAFRTCSFVAPDFDHAVNMFGAACYYVYKSYVR